MADGIQTSLLLGTSQVNNDSEPPNVTKLAHQANVIVLV
jgi:hypothetical protein